MGWPEGLWDRDVGALLERLPANAQVFFIPHQASGDERVAALDAGMTRAELAVVISGHGMSEPGNCAEFCNTSHLFTIDGATIEVSFPEAGAGNECMDRVDRGTVPNQYGTWWYGRGGWCPGLEVPMRMIDVTDAVTPGGEVTIEYEGTYDDTRYPGDGANIRLASWLVLSR